MPQWSKTVSATGPSQPLTLDIGQTPFNASVFVEVPVGVTVSYKVQYSGSVLADGTWGLFWLDHDNIPAGTTATADGNFMFPVTAVRVNVASISGGSIRLIVNQGLP